MRRWLGLALWAAVILLGAAAVGRGLPPGFWRLLTPQRLVETAVRLETGQTLAAPEAAPRAVPIPAPTQTPIPSPTPVCSDAPAPDRTPDGQPILPTSFPGGLTMKNDTDFAPDLAALLDEGPSLSLGTAGPQVLIVHTHTSEAYTPSDGWQYEQSDNMRTQDPAYNVLHVGDVLAERLEAAGLSVLHDRTVNDYPSYAGSYGRSGEQVQRALAEHPTIRVVIDLHRDAIANDEVVYKTVAALPDGEPCAQVMLVVGTNGSGLDHPDWRENLKLAVFLQNAADRQCPTLMRPIHLVPQRYNQHLAQGMLLIEVGSSGNTLPEALRAAELFGDAMGGALMKLMQ